MRLLVTSDLHYRLPSLDWVSGVAADFDAVVLAGDLLDVANPVPIDAQIVVLDAYLQRMAAVSTVLVASGNHDLDGPGDHGERVAAWLRRPAGTALVGDGQTVELGGIRFTVCPWWEGPVTRAEVDRQLEEAVPLPPQPWVWVYHAPPAGTALCQDGRRSFPDHDLAAWIDRWQPDLVCCGHIHQAPWTAGGGWYARLGRTVVFNAGHLRTRVPPHIVIDTEKATARWLGPDDDETVPLDRLRQPGP